MSWLILLRLVKDIGLEVILPIVKAVHKGDEVSAQERLSQALTARASGRATYEASNQCQAVCNWGVRRCQLKAGHTDSHRGTMVVWDNKENINQDYGKLGKP